MLPIDSNKESEVIAGLHVQLYKLLFLSLEKQNIDASREIYNFVLRKIGDSFHHKSSIVFSQFLKIPGWIYVDVLRKFQNEQSYFRDLTLLFFRDLLRFNSKFELEALKDTNQKANINQFIYSIYSAYIGLFHKSLFYKCYSDIPFILDNFNKIDNNERKSYELRHRITQLIKQGKNSDAVSEERNFEESNTITVLKFRTAFIMQSWIWFHFKNNMIYHNHILEYFDKLKLLYRYPDDLINDYISLINQDEELSLGIDDWDIIERGEEVYSPPQLHEWLTIGLVIYLLKLNSTNSIELSNIYNDRQFYFLFDRVKVILSEIRNEYNKWEELLQSSNLADFDERSRVVSSVFNQLKRRSKSIEEKEIALEKVSKVLVREFQVLISNAWSKSSRVREVFNFNGNIKILNEDPGYLKPFTRKIFFERAKNMFIESNYQHIYGVEDIGSALGRELDSLFFHKIIKSTNIKRYSSITTACDEFVRILRDNGKKADMIFVPPEFLNSNNLNTNSKFLNQWQVENKIAIAGCVGTYDEIPLILTYIPIMKNKLLVCNFKKSFGMELLKPDKETSGELNISIHEVDNEIASQKYDSDPEKWSRDEDGNILSKEEAIVRIMNSIIIEIEYRYRISVNDPEAYCIAEIYEDAIAANSN